ncbi:MAG: branched-chain amino acid ABC transporter permease, partial [Proteobacteria bacterium]|nr:branched-chain amino acid ABC transporter permease [Pseudomonadota bacterium]
MTVIFFESVLNTLIAGLMIGAIYGLMCVGLAMIFGLMRVINFAQGEFFMLGMYGTFYLVTWLGIGGLLGPAVAAVIASVAVYALGALIHRGLLSKATGIAVAGTEGD